MELFLFLIPDNCSHQLKIVKSECQYHHGKTTRHITRISSYWTSLLKTNQLFYNVGIFHNREGGTNESSLYRANRVYSID